MAADTKWNRIRKQVIAQTPDGSCNQCGANGEPLNVHHRYYEAGKKKWDYPLSSLVALCKKCHGKADELRRQLARATGPLDSSMTERALGYMEALGLLESGSGSIVIRSHEHLSGVADLFGVPDMEIIRNLDKASRSISFDDLLRLTGMPEHMVYRGGISRTCK